MAKQIDIPKPTKVPNNWCWVEMGKLAFMKSGYPFDSHRFMTAPSAATRPLIRIRDVVRGATETFTDEECPDEYIITRGEILIGMDGDFNVAKWQSGDALLNQRVCCIKSSSPLYLDDFLFYYLPDPLKKINDATPSVTVKHLSTKTLAVTPVPVPPLAEQQRIVDRIEYLFAKLDEAKEKAQSVLDGFETRKAAILHKAFTGELTAKWRTEHDVGMNSWKEQTIVDLCSLIVDCPHSTPEWTESGKVCLRTTNIKDGYLDLAEVRYVSEDTFCRRNQRAVPLPGDVLLTREGSIGDVGVIPDGWEICLGQRMMLLRPKKCKANFLVYFFRNPKIISDIRAETMGSTAPRMNIKELQKLKIACPDTLEQTEIVRILDILFVKEQQAKEAAEAVLEKIDLLKKSILARAFRGELGTNDPTEESAVELLKGIL